MGVFPVAVDFDFDESAGSFLGEEGVDGFEGPPLPAGLGLGDLGAEAGGAAEVEVLGAHLIATADLHEGSGDGEGEVLKRDGLILEMEVAGKVGEHLINGLILRLALGLAAETVDFVLDLQAEEVAISHFEVAIEDEFFLHLAIKGRDADVGFEIEVAGHEGSRAFHSEVEEVGEVAFGHEDVEVDGFAGIAVSLENDAGGSEVGLAKNGLDWLKNGIAVGAVDFDVVVDLQGDGVAGHGEAEVGDGGFAFSEDVREFAGEGAAGVEDAGYSGEDAEVGVLKGEVSVERGGTGFGGVPGSEAALRFNLAGGLGVAERGFVLHGYAEAGGEEADALEFELEGLFGGVFGQNDELRVGNDKFFDDDVVGAGFDGGLRTLALGGDIDFETVEDDEGDVFYGIEEFAEVGGEGEVLHAEEGGGAAAAEDDVIDFDAGGGAAALVDPELDGGEFGESDAEGAEFNFGLKVVPEIGDGLLTDVGFELGGEMFGRVIEGSDYTGEDGEEDENDDFPFAHFVVGADAMGRGNGQFGAVAGRRAVQRGWADARRVVVYGESDCTPRGGTG